MKRYTLTLITGQTNDFTISLNGTALTTTQFNDVFFSAAGTAQFTFDTSVTNFTIWDSSAMDGKSVTGTATIDSTKVYDVEWAAASGQTINTFTSVVEDDGYAMTKYQISDLMGKVKKAERNASGLPVYNVKLSELTRQNYSGGSYFSLSSGGYGKTGIYYVTNDLITDVPNPCRISIWNPGDVSNVTDRCVICWSGGAYSFPKGMVISFTIWRGSRDSFKKEKFFVLEQDYFTTTLTLKALQRYGELVFATDTSTTPISHTVTQESRALMSTSSLGISDITNNSSYVLAASAGATINRKILGVTSGTSAASWTTVGTSSKYTKRALQVTVNINETNLTLTANDWNTLFTLPTGYRPASGLTTGCIMTDNGTLVNGLIKITTSGAVQVMAGSNTTEVYGLLTIPVAS